MVFGKQIRISRITRNGRMLCIPMDHGLTAGPIPGLEEPEKIVQKVIEGGATAILVHKGIIKSLTKVPHSGIILHISASTSIGPSPNRKVLIGSVSEAIRLGADAVSVHINIGSDEEPEMLQQLGEVSDICDEYQIPLIAMMYPRGSRIKDPFDPDIVSHVARIGAEGGADIVKTVYTGSSETFRRVVKSCPVPVVIAGGPKIDDDVELLKMASSAVDAGALGVTFGRNIFQHKDPRLITKALSAIVIDRIDVEEAIEILNE